MNVSFEFDDRSAEAGQSERLMISAALSPYSCVGLWGTNPGNNPEMSRAAINVRGSATHATPRICTPSSGCECRAPMPWCHKGPREEQWRVHGDHLRGRLE